MADALEQFKGRTTDLSRVIQISGLLAWDMRTQMPPAGARHRGDHLAYLQKLAHDMIVDPEIGRLLDDAEPQPSSRDPDSYAHGRVRLMRNPYDKEVNVPGELRESMARAAAEGNAAWVQAKGKSDF